MTGWIPAIVLRLLVPFLIIPYPIVGALLAFLGDTIDVVLWEQFGAADISTYYNHIDKWLDTYMYLFMGYVALRWKNKNARNVALGLLLYRLAGVGMYSLIEQRWILLVFPDVFIFFFFFYIFYIRFSKKDALQSYPALLLIVGLLTIPKLYQEWLFHVIQFPVYQTIKSLFGLI